LLGDEGLEYELYLEREMNVLKKIVLKEGFRIKVCTSVVKFNLEGKSGKIQENNFFVEIFKTKPFNSFI